MARGIVTGLEESIISMAYFTKLRAISPQD
jgi:hypothetical protein